MVQRTRLAVVSTLSVPLLAACASGVVPLASPKPSQTAATASTPSLSSAPTPSPASGGRFTIDLTWVSELTGWALSADECASGLCPELSSTTDGGNTWHELPNPPASIQNGTVNCANVACISHVRFASTLFGYLYGPALLVTSNGGRSWRPEHSLPVEALEPTQGRVYRIVYDHGGCPGPCDRTLETAPAGSATWRTLLTIPFITNVASRQDTAQLVMQGSQYVYIAIYGDLAAGGGSQQAVLFRSVDAGRTWRRLRDPCGGSGIAANDATSFAASTGGFTVALCVPRGENRGIFVVTSNNAGASWGPPHPAPGSFVQLLAAASPTHLALATAPINGSGPITYTLYVSTDGGAHWRLAVSDPEVLDAAALGSAFLGFEDSLFGRWVGFEGTIWTTEDGGAHWTRRPFI
jgi:photosystem II stability/assembly factor-like uncharacterized protein